MKGDYKIFFSNIILSKPSGGGYVKSLKVESSIAPSSTVEKYST